MRKIFRKGSGISFMDSHSTTLILILVVLITLSAYFSATETAFSSFNRIRVKNMASSGNKRAKLVYALSEKYDELLSTILVGNNLVNIASTAIATVLFTEALGDSMGPTVSTVVMTIVVLTFGEISPKSLAKENAEGFSMFSAPIIRVLMMVLKPINFMFSLLKKGLNKLFKPSENRSMTDSELLTIVEEAEQQGGIDQEESEMLRNVIEFDDIESIDIMTPRVNVEAVPHDATNEEIAECFRSTGYSRLPVYDETIDSIVGIILEKNFYATVMGTDNTIDSILKPVEFIPPSMKISALLKLLQKNKQQMAVIVDEFGGTEGIITLEDVIEELVGEIWDEHDEIEQDGLQKIGEDLHKVSGSADLDDLRDFYHLECESDSTTINGWVTEQLDRIPNEGDTFTYEGLAFTVTKMDGNRADEITVQGKPIEKTEE